MSIIRPGSAPTPRPVPAIGITGVLKAIGSELNQPEPVKSPPGIGMTGALKARKTEIIILIFPINVIVTFESRVNSL
jgi:hypothetical protein